jgi:hypothetical protein
MSKQVSISKPVRDTQKAMVFAEAAKAKSVSGQIPEGDVRMTANVRADLHLRLKIRAARDRTTIGEIIEQLIERHIE